MDALKSEWADLLNAAPDPVLIVNNGGDVAFANSRVEAVFGYSANELVGSPVEMLIPERLRASHVRHLRW